MPVSPAPTTRTSTARSSLSWENFGAGVLSVQYEFVSRGTMTRTRMQTLRRLFCAPMNGKWPRPFFQSIETLQLPLEVCPHCPEGVAPMAHSKLLFGPDLAERLAIRRIAEDRIVAEPAAARRLCRELSFHNAGGFED